MYKKMMEKEKGLAVETVCLTKMYKDKAAVKQLNMSVREGEIYGFIGKNGAGKSTTMKMLCGLAGPTSGEIRLFGKPVSDPVVRRRMGVLIETPGLYPHMTARQNAVLKARCMGLGVALALLGNPDLLILDEPINGLDPEGIRELRQLVLRLHETGKTILISSHILGELSKISTTYGIIKDGEMIEQIASQALEEKCLDYFQIQVDDVSRALVLIQEAFPKVRTEVSDSRMVRVYGLEEGAGLIQLLVEKQIQVYASGFHRMDLEDYFLSRMEGGKADV